MPKTKEQRSNHNHSHYQKHKEMYALKRDKQRRIAKEFVLQYKRGKTCKCGEDHVACLQFHHTDSKTKDRDISSMVKNGCGIQRITEEIAKCELICANCHFKLHWNEDYCPLV